MVEIATVTTKGQIVIPSNIRNELGLEEGSQVVVSKLEDFIILKKINIADPKDEFRKLTEIGKKHSKKIKIKSEEDVVRKIHEGRKKV